MHGSNAEVVRPQQREAEVDTDRSCVSLLQQSGLYGIKEAIGQDTGQNNVYTGSDSDKENVEEDREGGIMDMDKIIEKIEEVEEMNREMGELITQLEKAYEREIANLKMKKPKMVWIAVYEAQTDTPIVTYTFRDMEEAMRLEGYGVHDRTANGYRFRIKGETNVDDFDFWTVKRVPVVRY